MFRQPAAEAPIRYTSTFERFTEEARRTLFFARAAALEAGAVSIDSEHILTGALRAAAVTLMVESPGGISCETIVQRLRMSPSARLSESTRQEVPFSAAVQQLLNASMAQADRLRHHWIRLEHILLALLEEFDSSAGQTLRDAGVDRETLLESASRAVAVDDRPLPYWGQGIVTGRVDRSE